MAMRRIFPARSVVSKRFINISQRSLALAVRFHETGEAEKVYKLEQLDSNFINAPLGPKEVGLKFLAAPINPSDINIANGTYGIRPKLPAIAGNEGVAEVISVGNDVKGLKKGDWVLPLSGATGTWTQFNKAQESEVLKFPHKFYYVTKGDFKYTADDLLARVAAVNDDIPEFVHPLEPELTMETIAEKSHDETFQQLLDVFHKVQFGGNRAGVIVKEIFRVDSLQFARQCMEKLPLDGNVKWLFEPTAADEQLNQTSQNLEEARTFYSLHEYSIDAGFAAILAINPSTAYRLLKDFAALKPGDWIIQNGANSMVGQAVIQMAQHWGIKTINVIRSDRPDIDDNLRHLTALGGDINIDDDYLSSANFKEILADLPPIKLGLNCVGGNAATNVARALGNGGTFVTYGGMSKKPLSIPFDLLTYKQLQLKGFWIADWYQTHSVQERKAMYDDITEMILEDKYTAFLQLVDFDDFSWALKQSQEPFKFRKIVLNLDFPDRLKEHDAKPEEDYWVFDTHLR